MSMTFEGLLDTITAIDTQLARRAKVAVNTSLTLRNWLFGYYIEEYARRGVDRARYGDRLMSELASTLSSKGASRCDRSALYRYRSFYLAYPGLAVALSARLLPEEAVEIVATMSPQSAAAAERLLSQLSYSHFEQLVRIDNPDKRAFYQRHCLEGGWSVRTLKRQIASLYFERTALSTDKATLRSQTAAAAEEAAPTIAIRDPYIFEFLGLRPAEVMGESDLEDALLDKLQSVLLELGHGFCFEARQKSILIGETLKFVDLIFYHRILKCHILVELKTGKFTHENIGQLNTYVSWYADNEMTEGDNPPIGLLLCTEKDQTVVKYALAGISNQLFVSRYQLALPTAEELRGMLGEVFA